MKQGDWINALVYYGKIADLYPNDKEVTTCIATALALMNRKEESFEAYEAALKTYGENYKTYVSYAISKAEFGEIETAIELYKKAIDENPDLPNAYTLLGNLYSDLGEYNLAIEQYENLPI